MGDLGTATLPVPCSTCGGSIRMTIHTLPSLRLVGAAKMRIRISHGPVICQKCGARVDGV